MKSTATLPWSPFLQTGDFQRLIAGVAFVCHRSSYAEKLGLGSFIISPFGDLYSSFLVFIFLWVLT